MSRRPPDAGVYLLASDAVWRWTSACAESLRSFNPELRVVVIPYTDELRIIKRLCAVHRFELWKGPDFAWVDRLGKRLGGPAPRHMRKLAAFDGPLEHFLYLDVDTVVLMDLEPVLTAVTERPGMVLFAHAGTSAGYVDEVYRPGPWRERFVAEHGTRAGNAGVWAAARGTFTPTQLARLADAAEPIAAEFPSTDQGFLNFCLDSTGAPVGNLHDFPEIRRRPMMWAGDPRCLESETGVRVPRGCPVGLVHWAGYGISPEMPLRSLWEQWAPATPPRVWPRAT